MHHSAEPIRSVFFHCHHEPKSIKAARTLRKSTNPFGLHPTSVLLSAPCGITTSIIMTFEEVLIQKTSDRAQCTGQALEEVLFSAKANDYLTIGVYESAKIMNV